jgi:hypothetical protein
MQPISVRHLADRPFDAIVLVVSKHRLRACVFVAS